MTTLKPLKNRFMEDPECQEGFAWADGEFTRIEALVGARQGNPGLAGRPAATTLTPAGDASCKVRSA